MATYFDVFNIKSDLQLNNVMNNLELSSNEMFALDDIINDYSTDIKEKRNRILEMFSGTNNYNYCRKLFLKEGLEDSPQQLNMNQTIELNKLFELASEKFKKVNCSQQFYQLLTQKTSKNIANAFFNMLKSIPEDSDCRFDPELNIGGQNFAQTIYPYVNELTTFLNGCKSKSKKEEVKESIEKEISFDDIKEFAEKYDLIPTNKNEKANNRTYAKFITYPKSMNFNSFKKDALKKFGNNIEVIKGRKLKNNRFIVGIWYNGIDNLNESIETQPDMFGGPDTYYKDGIEALDFDNVLDAMNKVAPEMDFVDDRDVKGKYSMIFQPKSSGLELNQKGLKKIKDYLSQRFGKENISVRLAHSQYAPEIKKLYVTFINQIDVQDELNESLEDTLNNFKYYITSSSDKDQLNMMKDKLEILFNGSNDTELRNTISELLSMINSKLNTIKPSIDECCELGNLLEPFKTTVVNITVNDEGCLEDVEKESATNNLKALASHINDKKDCCEENNIENMQTIMSLISSLASFFQKRLCESQSYEKYNDVSEELNDIKQRYLDGELDIYDATNEVDNIIGDKSNAEAMVDSWDDSSKHGLYGINNEALLNKISNDPNVYIQGRDEIDDGQELDVEKILDSIKYIANTYNKTFSEAKEIYSEISNTDVYSIKELDEDTVYDHSWYEVKGQKYPKRTKNGVICESKNDVLNDIIRDLDKYLADNNSIHVDYVCYIIEKNMKKNNIPEESFDDLFAEVYGKLVSHDIRITDEIIYETCSAGATCAASVATVPSPVKTKSPKRKHKKSKVDEMALNMFKRHIIEDVNSQIDANGNHYEYRDGYFYINGDIARTKSKYQMLESLDENIELETLPGFNSEEMRLLEDIEASGSVGNEDDNNQNNNSNNNNNANNNNNQQNTNQNINQDNLGNVEQNVTQDNDLTPQQRQLKKDTEQVLDQSMNSGSDTEVSVNQGLDNNNDQATNNQTSSNNVKYKVIGKDDSDSNNIKYIIQDPNSKETMVVDATKLRLEK